jgi:cytochrome c peroxidase
MTALRRGEFLFADATMCFQQWQSCVSCHPDARVDALNWDLLNDGMGNPKQTKNMFLAHKTPPAMLSGIRESAEKAVRAGMRYIQFTVRPEEDALAIDEYLSSLRPLPSPHLVNGRMSDGARRGRKVFEKAGCNACHPAPLFTNLEHYDVGTSAGLDAGKAYDTPTLLESWRTAPYLCDGRAATMREVLTAHNAQDSHGATKALTEQEIADLEAYVLSL